MLEDLGFALVYCPGRPHLTQLNLTSFLILELCGDTPLEEAGRGYLRAIGADETSREAIEQVRAGIKDLEAQGLIESSLRVNPGVAENGRPTPTAGRAGPEEYRPDSLKPFEENP